MQRSESQLKRRVAIGTPRSFPLNAEATTEILNSLTDAQIYSDGAMRRKHTRFDLGGARSIVTVQHPGGSIVQSECVLVDISEGGASFLYPGFLHANTECAIQIETLGNELIMVCARLVWCRFVTNPVHAVGVHWLEPINIKQFIPSKIWLEQSGHSDKQSQKEIEGCVLLVGFDEIENELLRVILKNTKLKVSDANFSGSAMDQITTNPFDLLILNSESNESSAEELVGMIRESGSAEPILLLADRPKSPQIAGSFSDITVLEKPFNNDEILATIRDILITNANPVAGTSPIISVANIEPSSVCTYIKKTKDFIPILQNAVEKNDIDEASRIVTIIKNTAEAFGFPLLKVIAQDMITQLNATASVQESTTEFRTLVRVINRLQVNSEEDVQ